MYKNSDTCLEKTEDNEPIFVLVARDKLAMSVIKYWIDLAQRHGVGPIKLNDANRVLLAMQEWQREHPPLIPD